MGSLRNCTQKKSSAKGRSTGATIWRPCRHWLCSAPASRCVWISAVRRRTGPLHPLTCRRHPRDR